jgi:hypothetical protein
MIPYSVIVFLVSLSFVVSPRVVLGQENTKDFLVVHEEEKTISVQKSTDLLRVSMSAADGELKATIHYLNRIGKKNQEQRSIPQEIDIPAGGTVTLFLDDMIVLQQTFTGNEIKIEKTLALEMIPNGDHKLHVEILSHPGGTQTKDISFTLDATPVVEIKSLEIEDGTFDPQVYFFLFGADKDHTGFLEVHVDERFVANVHLRKKDLNKTTKLSELIGKKVDVGGLSLGVHLLRIAAISANGSQGVQYQSFEINIQPAVSVNKTQEGRFGSLQVAFPKTSIGFFGGVEVYYQQGVILSRQAKKSRELTITRAEIEKAFTKYKHDNRPHPLDLVFAIRSSNGFERWVKVDFQ